MTGPLFEPEIDLPLEDPDALPIDEIRLGKVEKSATGVQHFVWILPDGTTATVGYPDRDIARRKGAEELRRRRQIAAMQRER